MLITTTKLENDNIQQPQTYPHSSSGSNIMNSQLINELKKEINEDYDQCVRVHVREAALEAFQ